MYRLLFTVTVMLALAGSAWSQTPTAADADFNGNNEVDIADFLLFVDAYGTQRGQANYDAKFDLNGDDIIGIPDFLIFVELYGQTVPKHNDPPIAHAGEYQSVDTGDLVTLNGANSSDPEGQPLTFVWRQVEGPNVTLSDATVARPTFSPGAGGHYAFELVVHDGIASSRPDTVGIDAVTISEAAVFVGGADDAFEYKETTGNQMVFTARSGAPQVQVGEVMVHSGDLFFLKKVTRVVRQTTSEVVVETEDASLTDVIEEADVRQTLSFPASKLALVTIDVDPLCLKVDPDNGNEVSVCATATNVGLTPSGTLKLTYKEGKLDTFLVDVEVNLTANLSIEASGQVGFAKSKDNKIDLTNRLPGLAKGIKNLVKLGQNLSVPIQVNPTVVLEVKGFVGAAAELKAGVAIDKTIGAGIKYVKGEGVGFHNPGLRKSEEQVYKEISLGGKANVRASVSAKLEVKVAKGSDDVAAGLASASLGIGPFAEFDASIKPGDQSLLNWAINLGIAGTAEVTGPFVKFFGFTLTLGKKSWNGVFPFLPKVTLEKGSILIDAYFTGIADNNRGQFYMLHSNAPESGGAVYEAEQNREGLYEYNRLFSLKPSDITIPLGITTDNRSLYVVGWWEDDSRNFVPRMVKYSKNGDQWETASKLNLLDENVAPVGVTYADGFFYVVDAESDKVYAYRYDVGDKKWYYSTNKFFDLSGANGDPDGITYVNERFYVVDSGDDKLYAYKSSGERDREADFVLTGDIGLPYGITSAANGLVYVVDNADGTIHEYGKPDLIVEWCFADDPSLTTARKIFTLHASVRNRGHCSSAVPATLQYYRSND